MKQSHLATGTTAKGFAGTQTLLKGFDLDQVKELPIRKIAIQLVVMILASYSLDNYKTEELKKLDEKSAQIAADTSRIQSELERYKSFEGLKKALDEDEMTIKTKLSVIRKLISDRSGSVQLLLAISNAMPKDVWLSEFKSQSTHMSVKGTSLGYSQISDFMKNLKDNATLGVVELVDTKQGMDETGIEIADFELAMKRR
jgi:Tfp pilus assembly protein PilN